MNWNSVRYPLLSLISRVSHVLSSLSIDDDVSQEAHDELFRTARSIFVPARLPPCATTLLRQPHAPTQPTSDRPFPCYWWTPTAKPLRREAEAAMGSRANEVGTRMVTMRSEDCSLVRLFCLERASGSGGDALAALTKKLSRGRYHRWSPQLKVVRDYSRSSTIKPQWMGPSLCQHPPYAPLQRT